MVSRQIDFNVTSTRQGLFYAECESRTLYVYIYTFFLHIE